MCTGKVPGGWCTPTDPYVGFEGAFKCLMEAGEVAFLKHTTVKEMVESKSFKGVSIDEFQLLCKNGQRVPVSDYLQCNWGLVPSNAIVTSSARTPEQRKQYQKFLQAAVRMYSHKMSTNSSFNDNSNNNDRFNRFNQQDRFTPDRWSGRTSTTTDRYGNRNRLEFSSTESPLNDSQPFENFELFESHRYGSRLNLMFQDATYGFKEIEETEQTFKSFLGEHEKIIYDIRQCPVNRMTLCVTSDAEYEKCVKMRVSYIFFLFFFSSPSKLLFNFFRLR